MPEVKLRPLGMNDLDNMMTWVNDSEVTKNLANFKGEITREREKEYLEKILASETDKVYAIETLEGTYIGNIGIHQIYWQAKNGRIGFVLRKEYHGRGYAQSALKELLFIAFEEIGLHKLWAIVWEDNPKTRYINRKIGFREEGILRDEYFHNGKYHNMIRMSLLEDGYRKMKAEIE